MSLTVLDARLDGERVGVRCEGGRIAAIGPEVTAAATDGETIDAAGELGLAYAALCVVDNLANGLGEGAISVAELEADRLINAGRLREGLAAVLPRLGAVGR